MESKKKLFKAIMVDDEIWALRGLRGIIDWESYGFEIAGTYTDPLQALEDIPLVKPDLMFTDIRMPDIDGMTLIEKVKEIHSDMDFVIVSAYKDFEIAKKALKHDVTDYLIKPLDKEEVRSTALRLYSGLISKKKDTFDILKYDLSNADTVMLPEISSFLCKIGIKEGLRILISDYTLDDTHEALLDNPVQIYIKDCPFSYLIKDSSVKPCVFLSDECLERIGVSLRFSSLAELLEAVAYAKCSYGGRFQFSDNAQTNAIQRYLYENLDKKLSMDDVANAFFLSKSYIFELFRNNSPIPAMNFLKHVRLVKAADLLSSKKNSVSEVAALVGFDDTGYFIKAFKSKYNLTPEQFMNQAK